MEAWSPSDHNRNYSGQKHVCSSLHPGTEQHSAWSILVADLLLKPFPSRFLSAKVRWQSISSGFTVVCTLLMVNKAEMELSPRTCTEKIALNQQHFEMFK